MIQRYENDSRPDSAAQSPTTRVAVARADGGPVTGTHARLETGDQVEPTLFDPNTSSIARIHDYWLGGKDNYAADRAEAERLMAV